MAKVDNALDVKYNQVPTKESFNDNEKQQPAVKYGYGVRHFQLVVFFICMSISFVARGHMGVTIVAVTNVNASDISDVDVGRTGLHHDNGTYFIQNSSVSVTVQKEASIYKTYNWSKPIQETVQGAFFLGYCIMMFPIGLVCQRWGGKIPLQISLLTNGIVSILTPWLIVWGGWKAVCACRIVQGLSQAGTYPGIQTLLANWVPESERGRLTSYVYTGTTVGTVIAYQLSGILAESSWGWPSIFWTVGVLCLLAFSFLTIFGASSPAQSKFISEQEKSYILGSVSDGAVQKRKTPWIAIITSKPMWGSFATHVGSGVGFVFFFTQVPSFIHYIYGINVKNSGILSSLPYVASIFTSVAYGVLSDYFTNKNIMSVRNARRVSNSISQIGIAVCLVCASFASSTALAVACLVVGMGCHMGIHTGWMVNHIDLAPNYSGTMMAIGNTLMNIFVVILPVCVSHVVTDVRNPHQWQIMMCLIAGICVICNALFVVFMSSDTQPWNDHTPDTSLEEMNLDTKDVDPIKSLSPE